MSLKFSFRAIWLPQSSA